MVKRSIDQKLRFRNLDARQGELKQEQWSRIVREGVALEGKVFLPVEKKKTSVRKGDKCSFWHVSDDRAQKKKKRSPHIPSPRCHEVEVCRRKEASEAKVTVVPFFDNRAYHLKGTCTRSPTEHGHPPECRFFLKKIKRVVRLVIRVCSRITRFMNNQTKSQRKAIIGENDDNAVAIMKIVPQLGCVSQDSEAFETRCKSLRTDSKSRVHWV